MSELKEIGIRWEENGELHFSHVYRKSDVDAVIAEKDRAIEFAKALTLKDIEIIKEKDKEIAELKEQLESEKASHYAESVDAGMRERRLKRALWLARAERAADRARIFYFNDLKTMLDIDGYSYDHRKKKGHKKLTARQWRIIWEKVERKCRAKAEEYK